MNAGSGIRLKVKMDEQLYASATLPGILCKSCLTLYKEKQSGSAPNIHKLSKSKEIYTGNYLTQKNTANFTTFLRHLVSSSSAGLNV